MSTPFPSRIPRNQLTLVHRKQEVDSKNEHNNPFDIFEDRKVETDDQKGKASREGKAQRCGRIQQVVVALACSL